ncbi:MAG: hypothetical protein ACTSUP_03885 [Candidatus Heimdallarchaeaceae archaeon]
MIKGFLRICAGIIGNNVLTFEDSEVSPAVSLEKLNRDHHAGFYDVIAGSKAIIEQNKVSIFKSGYRRSGFVKRTGFKKRSA